MEANSAEPPNELSNDQTFELNGTASLEEIDPVSLALKHGDWNELKSLSLREGGFGRWRKEVWLFLLHASPERADDPDGNNEDVSRQPRSTGPVDELEMEPETLDTTLNSDIDDWSEHQDERQIKLDTDRSFVIYPDIESREARQKDLNELIVSVFRKYPRLRYFQGYHDIITVIFLTFQRRDERLLCAEKFSLHRLRDSMGSGMEPLIGLLRFTKYLFRLVDPELSAALEQSSPLPYFALSNLLTLFSHDIPTLAQIQHVFDFLLCRPPIATVYLAVAFALTHKEKAMRLKEEGEEGMLHALMTSTPELSDGEIAEQTMEEPWTELQEAKSPALSSPDQLICDLPVSSDPIRSKSLSDGEKAVVVDTQIPEDPKSLDFQSSDGSGINPDDVEKIPSSPSHIVDENHDHFDSKPSPSSRALSLRPRNRTRRKVIALSSILSQADQFYTLYPPTHPQLSLDRIMGPKSVVFTWKQDAAQMESDEEVEALAEDMSLIVLPFEDSDHEEDDSSDDGHEIGRSPTSKGKGRTKNEGGKRVRRKLRKRRPMPFNVDRRTAIAGIVLVLSVALAVYGVRLGTHAPMGRNSSGPFGRADRDWRRAGSWIGASILGVGERLIGGF